MDRYDSSHIRGVWIVVFALHGVEEHLFRGVYPVPGLGVCTGFLLIVGGSRGGGRVRGGGQEGGGRAWDGPDFAVGW